jgi:type II secretory pathway component PulJ
MAEGLLALSLLSVALIIEMQQVQQYQTQKQHLTQQLQDVQKQRIIAEQKWLDAYNQREKMISEDAK